MNSVTVKPAKSGVVRVSKRSILEECLTVADIRRAIEGVSDETPVVFARVMVGEPMKVFPVQESTRLVESDLKIGETGLELRAFGEARGKGQDPVLVLQ